MSADYDRSFLQEYADRLYTLATIAIAVCTIVGALIGYAAGAALERMIRSSDLPLALAIFGGVIGFVIGWRKSFWLKLEAQRTLCQMMIERHLEQLVSLEQQEDSVARDRMDCTVS